jgi:YD repeat-containing protein
MAQRRRPDRTRYHYDRHGRLRAAVAPDGTVTRWLWDGVQSVGVSPAGTPPLPQYPTQPRGGPSHEYRF